MKQRIAYYDILRGIAIMGVVAIHCTFIGFNFNELSIDFKLTVLWKNFINVAVPLFLALSGYFMSNKKVSTKNQYISFLKKQLPKVLIPYVIWSVLYLSISIYIEKISLITFLNRLITFQSLPQFYFILLILQYYILLPLLQKLANVRGLIISLVISLISCIFIFYLRYFTDYQVTQILYTGLFPIWLVFFVLGLYVKNNSQKINSTTNLIFIIIFYLFSIIETYFVYQVFNIEMGMAATSVKISSFLYSFFIILFAFRSVSLVENKLLQYTGEISFGIYLAHPFFLYYPIYTLVNESFNQLDNVDGGGILLQFILFTLTLFVCILLAVLSRKLNKKLSIKMLGL